MMTSDTPSLPAKQDTLIATLRDALGANDSSEVSRALAGLMQSVGMSEMARRTGRPRQTLYKFADQGNPTLGTFFDALRAVGLKLTIA